MVCHSPKIRMDKLKKGFDTLKDQWASQDIQGDISSVQSLSCVQLFATPWITAHQASLSITNSQSSPRLTSIESVMPSSHLILCRPRLLLPPIPPSISLFQWVNSSHEVAKVLVFQLQHQSFQRNPRADLLQNGLVGSSCSPRDSQESSPTPCHSISVILIQSLIFVTSHFVTSLLYTSTWTHKLLTCRVRKSNLHLTICSSFLNPRHPNPLPITLNRGKHLGFEWCNI